MKRLILSGCVVLLQTICFAQDPSFAQFFSSPLNINPALTANINADWRMISNFRDQWIGPASPYATGTVSFDSKIFNKKIMNMPDRSYMGIGSMLMYDNSMDGIQRSFYASLNLSYNLLLAENETNLHRLAAGFGTTYGNRRVDFSRLDFENQWVGLRGFDTNLPTGESALSQMKGWFSVSSGLTYSFQTETSNFDIGAAAYHLNQPKQTFLEDPHQYVGRREVVHANFETLIRDRFTLNFNSIFQRQSGTSYYSFGMAGGQLLGQDHDMMLTAGVWYWSDNAVIPYVGLAKGRLQMGISTDVTINKLNKARTKPGTFELSLIIRGERGPNGILYCPWK